MNPALLQNFFENFFGFWEKFLYFVTSLPLPPKKRPFLFDFRSEMSEEVSAGGIFIR